VRRSRQIAEKEKEKKEPLKEIGININKSLSIVF